MNQFKTIAAVVNPYQILQGQGYKPLLNFGEHMFDTSCNLYEELTKLNRGLDRKVKKNFFIHHHAYMALSSKIDHDHQFIQAIFNINY